MTPATLTVRQGSFKEALSFLSLSHPNTDSYSDVLQAIEELLCILFNKFLLYFQLVRSDIII